MSKEILINISEYETRIAILNHGLLHEIQLERTNLTSCIGNIYKGRVVRVLPGIQAAFVEIGLNRTGFLHVSDIIPHNNISNPLIENHIYEGEVLLVQVIKDAFSSKGACLSMHISFSSRFFVYQPLSSQFGISKQFRNKSEKQRISLLVQTEMLKNSGGYIVRTAAEKISSETLLADIHFLQALWQITENRSKVSKAGTVIHSNLSLALQTIRDQINPALSKIIIDSHSFYQKAKNFVSQFIPQLGAEIEYYQGERGLFENFSIEQEVEKALLRKVPLQSGGYLVFDETEAMTVIDVNSGGCIGQFCVEKTLLKINIEAADMICRQLRLRNIGGIIVIDFINLQTAKARRKLLAFLEESLATDSAKTTLHGISSLGLVEMTRKRSRQNLAQVLCETCPTCQGRGQIKTSETICHEILRKLLHMPNQREHQDLIIRASALVITYIHEKENLNFEKYQALIAKKITLQIETTYTQEQYDIIAI